MIRKHIKRGARLDRVRLPQGFAGEHAPQDEAPGGRIVECGWGRLIAGHTFARPQDIAEALLHERPGQRDIAYYVDKPHVVVACSPQRLFVDPSESFRLWLGHYVPAQARRRGFRIRRLSSRADLAAINAIYQARGMVPVDPEQVWRERGQRKLLYVLAEDRMTGEVIGVAMGLDHVPAFGDDEATAGASLWALAVAPQTPHAGVGEALTRYLAEQFQARGRSFMDLSTLHDNQSAIELYRKLGFQPVQVFAVKRRNAINEPLFSEVPAVDGERLNPYAQIIVDEARRRGVRVELVDAENGYFRLSHGGRSVLCRESLSELTSAIAMSRCADKRVTQRVLAAAGLQVPAQQLARNAEEDAAFLAAQGSVVVKPVDGEQGQGITVDVRTPEEVQEAVKRARRFGGPVLLERYCPGLDLRVVVIDHQVVAAAVRKPASVVGDGHSSIETLVRKQSRRRAAATGGESRIPLDAETRRCVAAAGYAMDEVLPPGQTLNVRKTANLHTGGTIHDVTAQLHPVLRAVSEQASRALAIPVTGLDLLVPAVDGPDYVIIEANERPGLANHEPQPTAARFVDLLFPSTRVA